MDSARDLWPRFHKRKYRFDARIFLECRDLWRGRKNKLWRDFQRHLEGIRMEGIRWGESRWIAGIRGG
jgi:hypothetical protein